MGARNILVTVPFFDNQSKSYLESNGCTVRLAKPDGNATREQLVELLAGCQGWIVGHAWVTREILAAHPDLLVIARRGVGYERVDVAAAEKLGKVVTIAAGGNAPSVADHTVGLMLASGRRFHESQAQMADGDWSILVGTELFQKTVGLIGFGSIARQVSQRLAGFDVNVLAYAPRPDLSEGIRLGVSFVDLSTLLRQSDYVSLHSPLTNETRNLIDENALRQMKPTSILLNTSRGGLIDEVALLKALKHKSIRGAALDVFHGEIDPAFKSVADELLALPNFVATPHAAGSTDEALARSNLLAARSIIAVFDGTSPSSNCIVTDGRANR
ncbi:phosphoglycerate dehydrogenase [Pararhizobium sp. DWP3-4]|uniref:phosphoglycerate dehydrogenase n=1 Tax=Pararhizobium sp. DWP3-4 TaxID=2804565 RepID=UPI003CFB1CFF